MHVNENPAYRQARQRVRELEAGLDKAIAGFENPAMTMRQKDELVRDLKKTRRPLQPVQSGIPPLRVAR